MNIEILTALTTFAFVSSITPGPNNLMLMSSGANFGFKLTIPHMLGVSLGFVLMVCLVGSGLIQIYDIYPITYQILKVFSVIYLVYLAFKIATSKPIDEQEISTAKPFSFIQAVVFQWINPKAWTMALTAISVYAPSKSMESILLVGVIFGAINLPSVGIWTVLGQQLNRFLTSDIKLKIFNITMALLLIASLYPMVV